MPYANNKGADQPAHSRIKNTSTCHSRNFKTLAAVVMTLRQSNLTLANQDVSLAVTSLNDNVT